ncbi:TetR/AcrR family transcriptional regulator [Mycobacterium simiae]|uniref:TetR/AcrR family transcriptional regulator n=1 Tax=Mycobacterium simiae TaxID=1784 RepID=UPI001E391058|nr:TetR/AcrR family transcriptional regulator [Mycobacterium simiae]
MTELGYWQATIREIARAAGVTGASRYHYFPTNSALLTATGEEIEAIVAPRLRAVAAQHDTSPTGSTRYWTSLPG